MMGERFGIGMREERRKQVRRRGGLLNERGKRIAAVGVASGMGADMGIVMGT